MKKHLIIFLQLYLLFIILTTNCKADNKYIYPQWWGMELKAQDGGNYPVYGAGLYTKDGNYYIMCSYYPDNKTRKLYLYDFFNNKIIAQWAENRMTGEFLSKWDGLTYSEYFKKYGYTSRYNLDFPFPSGKNKGSSEFEFDTISETTGHCDNPWGHGFSMKSLTNSTEYRKQLIYTRKTKTLFKTSNECGIMDGRSKAYIKSESLIVSIYSLDDGTYLLIAFKDPFIIRIMPTAISPFIANRDDLFLVNFNWMQEEYDKIYSDVLHERNKPPFPEPIYLLENIDARITEKLYILKRKGVAQ